MPTKREAVAAEDDFEFLTNINQLPMAPEPKFDVVVIPELRLKCRVYELSAFDGHELAEANKIYRNGEVVDTDYSFPNLKFLAFTMRDLNGQRIFPTVDAAIAKLRDFPLSVIEKLVIASNKVGDADPVSAEKNSEETPTDSSNSSSAES